MPLVVHAAADIFPPRPNDPPTIKVVPARFVVPLTAKALLPMVAPPIARDVPAATPRTGVTNVADVVAEIAPEPFSVDPNAVATFVPRPEMPAIGNPVVFVSVPPDGVPSAPPLTTKAPAVPTFTPRAVATPVPSEVEHAAVAFVRAAQLSVTYVPSPRK